MSAILPFTKIDSTSLLARYFILENGTLYYGEGAPHPQSDQARMILSNDPRIWRPLGS